MSSAVAGRNPGEQAPAGELSHKQILEVMSGLLAALFTALISSTIVATALPTIMADLNGTQTQYTWVITASLLAMTITTPIWGKLSDLVDKKWLIQVSIVLFVLGSIGAGACQEIWQMMACRAVQGIAMGGLTALVQSIMGTIIAPRQRGRYVGYMGAVMAVATVSGPLLGGVITDGLGWRWCFYVCVPLAVIALILLQVTLKLPALQKRHVKIDYLGAFLLACAAAAPMLWVTFAGNDFDWISWQSAAFAAAFVVAAGLAVMVELRVSEPIVPIRVLKNSTTAWMIIASLAVGVAMFGAGVFMTQYFQLAGGNSPTKAGLMTIPMIATQMLSSVIGGQIVSRTGHWKPVMVVGAGLMLVGLGGLGLTDHTTGYGQVAVCMAVMGLGVGPLIQNIVLVVQNTVDVSDVGASSATISFFRSVGGAVGVSVLGAVLADQVRDKVAAGLRSMGGGSGPAGGSLDLKDLPGPVQTLVHHAYGDAFGTLFMIAAIVAVATLLAVIFVRGAPLRTTVAMQQTGEQTAAASASRPASAARPTSAPAPLRPGETVTVTDLTAALARVLDVLRELSTQGGQGNGRAGTDGHGRFRTYDMTAPPTASNGHAAAKQDELTGPDGALSSPERPWAGSYGAAGPDGRPDSHDGQVVTGMVRRRDRTPAPAVLTLTDFHGHELDKVRTGPDGSYRLRYPTTGTYLLVCTPDSDSGHQPAAETVAAAEGSVTRDIVLHRQ